jgi:hypothetical protein
MLTLTATTAGSVLVHATLTVVDDGIDDPAAPDGGAAAVAAAVYAAATALVAQPAAVVGLSLGVDVVAAAPVTISRAPRPVVVAPPPPSPPPPLAPPARPPPVVPPPGLPQLAPAQPQEVISDVKAIVPRNSNDDVLSLSTSTLTLALVLGVVLIVVGCACGVLIFRRRSAAAAPLMLDPAAVKYAAAADGNEDTPQWRAPCAKPCAEKGEHAHAHALTGSSVGTSVVPSCYGSCTSEGASLSPHSWPSPSASHSPDGRRSAELPSVHVHDVRKHVEADAHAAAPPREDHGEYLTRDEFGRFIARCMLGPSSHPPHRIAPVLPSHEPALSAGSNRLPHAVRGACDRSQPLSISACSGIVAQPGRGHARARVVTEPWHDEQVPSSVTRRIFW